MTSYFPQQYVKITYTWLALSFFAKKSYIRDSLPLMLLYLTLTVLCSIVMLFCICLIMYSLGAKIPEPDPSSCGQSCSQPKCGKTEAVSLLDVSGEVSVDLF